MLSFFFVLFSVDVLGLTQYSAFKQSMVISSQTIVSQLQKIESLLDSRWWSHVTDNNRIVQLAILSVVLTAGVVTLAITGRQISRMTRQSDPPIRWF